MLVLFFCACGIVQAQENLLGSPDSLAQLLHIDSLIAAKPVDSLNRTIDATTSKLDALQDSLNIKTQFPDSHLPDGLMTPVLQKADSARLKMEAFADSLQKKVQVPDSLKKFLPQEANLLDNQVLPDIGPEELDKVKALTGAEEFDKARKLGEEAKELTGLDGAAPLKEAGELKELEKLSGQTEGLNDIGGKAGHIPETAEGEVKKTKAFQALEEQKGAIDEQTDVIGQLGEEDYFKEKAVAAVKDKAKDHFAGHADKLQAAQEKLAKIKKDYPEGLSSIKDLPKRRPNPMRGKPFKDRLVLGLTLQIHQAQTPNMDISPFAAYRLTERLSLGLGGNYRLMTKNDFKGLTREGAVYGGRGFAELKIYKGIFAHAGYEMMKSPQREALVNTRSEREGKVWVDGLMIGAGKDYKIARYIKGNMQVLYNFLNEMNSPYQNKVMVRLGFSFQLKDKIKKPKIDVPDKEEMLKEGKQKIEETYRQKRVSP